MTAALFRFCGRDKSHLKDTCVLSFCAFLRIQGFRAVRSWEYRLQISFFTHGICRSFFPPPGNVLPEPKKAMNRRIRHTCRQGRYISSDRTSSSVYFLRSASSRGQHRVVLPRFMYNEAILTAPVCSACAEELPGFFKTERMNRAEDSVRYVSIWNL